MRPHPRQRYTRRDFLQRSAASAIALPSLARSLAACTKPGEENVVGQNLLTPSPDRPVTLPMQIDPIAADTPIEQGAELLLFNWDSYIWKPIVRRFVEKFGDYGISFTAATTFNNMDEGDRKALRPARSRPTCSSRRSTRPQARRRRAAAAPEPRADPEPGRERLVAVPEPLLRPQDGATRFPSRLHLGVSYRRDAISDTEFGMDNPYELLWDPRFEEPRGRVRHYRDTIGKPLLNGITDINTERPGDRRRSRRAPRDDRCREPRAPRSTARTSELPAGRVRPAVSWSGDIVAGWVYLPRDTDDTRPRLLVPGDRLGPLDNDCIAIPANAPKPARSLTSS